MPFFFFFSLMQVLVASFVVQLFTLANPLLSRNLISADGRALAIGEGLKLRTEVLLCRVDGVGGAALLAYLELPVVHVDGQAVKACTMFALEADGADVRMVYSTQDALKIARDNPQREVVFFAIGFETTTPPTASRSRSPRTDPSR